MRASPCVLNGTASKQTTRAPAYRAAGRVRRPAASAGCVTRRDREDGRDPAPDQRRGRARAASCRPRARRRRPRAPGALDSAGRPDEEHEAGHEPGRDEGGEHEEKTARHGPTVLSPPVTGVLFTCAGQRVDIVTAFKRAGARTVAADVNQLAPALYHADAHAFVPRVDDPDYVATLRTLVARARRLAHRAADRPRPRRALARAGRARRASCSCRSPSRRRARGQVARASALRRARDRLAADTWLPDDVAGRRCASRCS